MKQYTKYFIKNKTMQSDMNGLTSSQEMFLGITFIIILIIMIIVRDKSMAILIVGLIANFFIISSQMVIMNERFSRQRNTTSTFVAPRKPYVADKRIPVDHFTVAHKPEEDFSDYQGNVEVADKPDYYFDKLSGNEYLAKQTVLRGMSDRVNPANNNRQLVEKYITHELDEEEAKPWWGREDY